MKRFLSIVLVVVLALVAFGTSGCVDIDEALPHYKQTEKPGPK